MAGTPQANNNSFFGVRVSNPNVNVNNANPTQLMYSNDYNSETFYATNGTTPNGYITLGNLKDGGQGMQVVDSSGYVLFEMNGQTWYWYDKTTNTNVMQVGLLPDGTYGMAIAKPGYNVGDAIT